MSDLLPGRGARVAFEEEGTLAHVVFDGGKGNVLDRPLLRELARALHEAAAPGVKAVLIEGAGDHFSFGASVEDHGADRVRDFLRQFHDLFRALLDQPMVRMAAVRGQCLGGGLELALACQRIFAAPDAKLGQPEIKLAVFAPVASLLLPERVGPAAADDLLLSGRTVDAAEALAMGLVDELADDAAGGPAAAARAWLRRHVLPLSASSLRFAARAAWTVRAASFRRHLDEVERLYLDELMSTPDAIAGIEGFLARKAAR